MADGACPAGDGVTRFSELSLEELRGKLAAFADERDWAQFHTPRNLALALTGEVGELAELFQWRGDAGAQPGLPDWSEEDKTHLGEELSDVLLYLVRLSERSGVDLSAAVLRKLLLNAAKYPAELARARSDKYTRYTSAAVGGGAAPAEGAAAARSAAAAAAVASGAEARGAAAGAGTPANAADRGARSPAGKAPMEQPGTSAASVAAWKAVKEAEFAMQKRRDLWDMASHILHVGGLMSTMAGVCLGAAVLARKLVFT